MVLDPLSPAFARDPYAAYDALRAAGAPVWDAGLSLWLLPHFDWVAAAALDKRLVRAPDGVFTADEDCARLCGWSENIVQYFDLDRSDAKKALAENTTAEFYDYLKALAAQRRREPRDDLITRLAAAEDAGTLSHNEFISTAMLILMAGHGSSIDVMSSGLHALLRFPDQMARLRADPALLPGAVQEMFRFEPPLPFFHRFASEDVELAGRTFPKGTKFGLLYGAANRDPAAFAEPNRFDVGRTPNRHLGFGYGAHLCLGNHIARMTMETVFGALLQRRPAITLLDEPVWKTGLSVRGPKALQVKLA